MERIRVIEKSSLPYPIPSSVAIKNLKDTLSGKIFKLLEDGNKYIFNLEIRYEDNIRDITRVFIADLGYQQVQTEQQVYVSREELLHRDIIVNKGFWKRCKFICSYLFGKKYKYGQFEFRKVGEKDA